MKNKILVLFFLFVALQSQAQIEGYWKGEIDLGVQKLETAFDIKAAENGYSATFDVPAQGAFNIPVDEVSFQDSQLQLKMNAMDASYSGTLKDSVIEGTFTQRGMTFPLNLAKAEKNDQQKARPQDPQPPFDYQIEEVTFVNPKEGNTLAGTLTIPEGEGPFPAMVLVSGSGQQNRDEELLGHKPFLVLSDYLARHGIAVLRYDDRGVGGSKGEVENATTLDFADDAEAAFNLLRKQKRIDTRHVGIIGHSEGGLIAPIVASRNGKVNFVVLLAGQGTTGADILLQQNERIYQLDSVPQPLIDRRLELLRSLYAVMDTLPVDNYQPFTIALCDKYSEGLTADQRKSIGLRRGDAIGLATQMALPWMRTFVKLDNSSYLSRLRCPILAVNGDKDCQVLPVNLQAISDATQGRADIRLMPGLNHLMQHCRTGAPSEYMLIDETMAPEVLQTVADWILQVSKTKK